MSISVCLDMCLKDVGLVQAKAVDSRDALAKGIYGRLFNWLIARINSLIDEPRAHGTNQLISVLDIFGFEQVGYTSIHISIHISIHMSIHMSIHRGLDRKNIPAKLANNNPVKGLNRHEYAVAK